MAKFIGIKLIIFTLLICTLIQNCRCVSEKLTIKFFPYTNGRFDRKAALKVEIGKTAVKSYTAYKPDKEYELYTILKENGEDANAEVVLIPTYLKVAEQIVSGPGQGLDNTKKFLNIEIGKIIGLSENQKILLVGYSDIGDEQLTWKVFADVIEKHKQKGQRKTSDYVSIYHYENSQVGLKVPDLIRLTMKSLEDNKDIKLASVLYAFAHSICRTTITVRDVTDGNVKIRPEKIPIRMSIGENFSYRKYRQNLEYPGGGPKKHARWIVTSIDETVKLLESNDNKEEFGKVVAEIKINDPEMKVYLLSYPYSSRDNNDLLVAKIIGEFIHGHTPEGSTIEITGYTDIFKNFVYLNGPAGEPFPKIDIHNLDEAFKSRYTIERGKKAVQIIPFLGNMFSYNEMLQIPIKVMGKKGTNAKILDPSGANYSIAERDSKKDLLLIIIKSDRLQSLFSDRSAYPDHKIDFDIYVATLIENHGNLDVEVWGAKAIQPGPIKEERHIDSFIKAYTSNCGLNAKSFVITYSHDKMKRKYKNGEEGEELTDYENTDFDDFFSKAGKADAPRLRKESAQAKPVPKLQQP